MGEEGPKVWYRDANRLVLEVALLFCPFAIAAVALGLALRSPMAFAIMILNGIHCVEWVVGRWLGQRRTDPIGDEVVTARIAGVERVEIGRWWRLRPTRVSVPPVSFRTSARAPSKERAHIDEGILYAPFTPARTPFGRVGVLPPLFLIGGQIFFSLLLESGRTGALLGMLLMGSLAVFFVFVALRRIWSEARGSRVLPDSVAPPEGSRILRLNVRSVEQVDEGIEVVHQAGDREMRTVLRQAGPIEGSVALSLLRATLAPQQSELHEELDLKTMSHDEAHAAMLAQVEAEAQAEAEARVAEVTARRKPTGR